MIPSEIPGESPSTSPDTTPRESRFVTRRFRRRTTAERLLWVMWGIVLLALLEFALNSQREQEPQAAIIAGALFVVILVAGLLANLIWRIEAEEQDKYHS